MLVEMLVALLLLTALASILPVALNSIYRHRRHERFERLGLLELRNVSIRLRRNTESKPADAELSDWFSARYPQATLSVLENSTDASTEMQQVRITIEHPSGDERPPLRSTVTTWLLPEPTE